MPTGSVPLRVFRPPYRRLEPTDHVPLHATPGVIVAVDARDAQQIVRDLGDGIALEVRREFPFAPVVVVLPSTPDPEDVRRLGSSGVSAVLRSDDDVEATLREALSRPENLPRSIADWLRLTHPRLDPRVTELIRNVLRTGPRHRRVRDLLHEIREPETSVRRRLSEAGLPTVGDWMRFSHAVRAALTAQREPGEPLLRIAFRFGYSDHASLIRQCKRLFGDSTSVIRETLGWEWWATRFLELRGTRKRWL